LLNISSVRVTGFAATSTCEIDRASTMMMTLAPGPQRIRPYHVVCSFAASVRGTMKSSRQLLGFSLRPMLNNAAQCGQQ
jgi:hypothetical protein